jgi:hypothetical protein
VIKEAQKLSKKAAFNETVTVVDDEIWLASHLNGSLGTSGIAVKGD